ncbi:hypothetical protein K7432_007918 [Basidiobolus ranarum]|uniref:mRNA guanylyltransferase n=1 Tax=Basidiobolus ranarum TaxID=34480 RepID=A0ABR2VZE9_9FUNG
MSTSQPPNIPNSESLGMLVDPAYERTLQNRVKELLAWRHDSFPGSQAVYFETSHLEYLKSEDYFVCEQNGGIRCLLFSTITPKGPATFVIDSKNSFRYLSAGLPVRDHPTFQHETLLDGELLVEKTGEQKLYRYLICDLIVLNKVLVAHKSFNNRLGMLNQEVILPFNRMVNTDQTKRPPFRLELKKMERSYGLKVVLEHKNNGLLFTPVRSPYTCGLSRKLLKWKSPSSYTADLKIRVTYNIDRKPIYSVMAACNLNHKFLDHLQLEPSLFTEWRPSPPDGRIAEFRWDSQWPVTIFEKGYAPKNQKGGWRFVRFRDDKDTANEEEFAKLVRDGMPHAVSREVLESQVEEIRSNWKIREKTGVPSMQPPSGQSSGPHSQQSLHGSHERRSSTDTSGNLIRESPLPSPRYDQGFNQRRDSHDSSRKGSQDSITRKSSQDEAVKKHSPPALDSGPPNNGATSNLSKSPLEHSKSEDSPTKPTFPHTTESSQIIVESKNTDLSDTHSDQPTVDRVSKKDDVPQNISPKPVHKVPALTLEDPQKGQNQGESHPTGVGSTIQDIDTSSIKQPNKDDITKDGSATKDVEATKLTSNSAQDWSNKSSPNAEMAQSLDQREERTQHQNPGNGPANIKPLNSEEIVSALHEIRSNEKHVEKIITVAHDVDQKVQSNEKPKPLPATVHTEVTENTSSVSADQHDPSTIPKSEVQHAPVTMDTTVSQSKGLPENLENNPKQAEPIQSSESNGNERLSEFAGNTVKRKSLGVGNLDESQKHKKILVASSPIQRELQLKQQQLHMGQQKQQPLSAPLYENQMMQSQQQHSLNRPNPKKESVSDADKSFNQNHSIKAPQLPSQRLRSSSDASITKESQPYAFSGPQAILSREQPFKNDASIAPSHPGPGQVSMMPQAKASSPYHAGFHGTSPVLSNRPLTKPHTGSGSRQHMQDSIDRRTSSGHDISLLDKMYQVETLTASPKLNSQSTLHSLSNVDVARLHNSTTSGVNPATSNEQVQKFPHHTASTQNHPSFQPNANLKLNDNQVRRDPVSNPTPFNRNNSIAGYTPHSMNNAQANPRQTATETPHIAQQHGFSDLKELQRGPPRYGTGHIPEASMVDKQLAPRHSISDIQYHPNLPKNLTNNDNREALRRSMTSPAATTSLNNEGPIATNPQHGRKSSDILSVEGHDRIAQGGYRPSKDVSTGPSPYASPMDPNQNPHAIRNHQHRMNQMPMYPQGQAPSRSQLNPQPGYPQEQPIGTSSQYHPPISQTELPRRAPVHSMMSMPTQYSMSASKSPGYRHAVPQSSGSSMQSSPQIVPTRQENWQPMKDVGISPGYPQLPPQPSAQWSGNQGLYHPSTPAYNPPSIHPTSSQPRGQPQSKGKLDFIMNSTEEEPDWRNTRL